MSAEMDRQIEKVGEAIRQAAHEERAMIERIKHLEDGLRDMMTLAEVTNTCLEMWNGKGSPLNYETYMERARALLDRDPKSNEVGE